MVQEVNLPDGSIARFPDGMPKDAIQSALQKQLLGEEKPWWRDYLDIPAGLAGAATGAKLGSLTLNPIITIIGGIVGGMAGTFAGEVAEDVIDEKDIEYGNAFKEALVSGGIDVALLGTGKFVGRPFLNYVKRMRGKEISPQEAAKQYLAGASVGTAKVGTRESAAASQNILQQYGATLTPFQATGRHAITQRIADIGLFAQRVGEKNFELVNKAVDSELQKITGRSGFHSISANDLGADIYSLIDEGRKASFATYDEGMQRLGQIIDGSAVSTNKLYNAVENWIVEGRRKSLAEPDEISAAFSIYDGESVKFAENMLLELQKMKRMPANVLIDYERKLMSEMSKFSDFNSNSFNSTAARELSDLSTVIRDATKGILKDLDPKAAEEYSSIKSAYAETLNGIIPTNMETLVKNGKKQMFDGLGRLISTSGSEAQLKSMMNSIKVAHAELVRAGKNPEPLENLLNSMKSGFLTQYMPKLISGEFDVRRYSGLAEQFAKPKEAARLNIILGKDAPKVKQLFNLMEEASKSPASNAGELAVRSKELSSLQGIASGAIMVQDLFAGGAILATPIMMAKYAYKPQRVNQMIAFQNTTFKNRDAMLTAAGNLAVDIFSELTEEEQYEVMDHFGLAGETPPEPNPN